MEFHFISIEKFVMKSHEGDDIDKAAASVHRLFTQFEESTSFLKTGGQRKIDFLKTSEKFSLPNWFR
jgi:hypothetical protein